MTSDDNRRKKESNDHKEKENKEKEEKSEEILEEDELNKPLEREKVITRKLKKR